MSLNTQKLHDAYAILPIQFKENQQLPLFAECDGSQLIYGGKDVFQRDYYMQQNAYQAWQKMYQTALQEGVTLQVVSAYRGYLYQANLILNKLNKGVALEDILKVLALPGFSEHHTGRALDLSSTETKEVLVEDFEKTKAFAWLIENAHKFQFYLSYPRDNKAGFIYEPWHWCYKLSEAML